MKIKDRPLIGTIVKPKLGLTPKEQSDVAYKTWIGGIDLVKDDENLTSMNFSRFEERVSRVLELKDRAEEETGEKKDTCQMSQHLIKRWKKERISLPILAENTL